MARERIRCCGQPTWVWCLCFLQNQYCSWCLNLQQQLFDVFKFRYQGTQSVKFSACHINYCANQHFLLQRSPQWEGEEVERKSRPSYSYIEIETWWTAEGGLSTFDGRWMNLWQESEKSVSSCAAAAAAEGRWSANCECKSSGRKEVSSVSCQQSLLYDRSATRDSIDSRTLLRRRRKEFGWELKNRSHESKLLWTGVNYCLIPVHLGQE